MPVKAARVGIELINIEVEGDTTGNMCIVKFWLLKIVVWE